MLLVASLLRSLVAKPDREENEIFFFCVIPIISGF